MVFWDMFTSISELWTEPDYIANSQVYTRYTPQSLYRFTPTPLTITVAPFSRRSGGQN